MRSHPALRGRYLVALSGYARPEDIADSQSAGFDEHLAKPVTIEKPAGRACSRALDRRGIERSDHLAVQQQLADVGRLLHVGSRLRSELLLRLADRVLAHPSRERRALLEGADGRPQHALQLFALLAHKALERERVADVTAEVLEHTGVCFGQDALADGTHDLRALAELGTFELPDKRVRRDAE
jgi:CheY-like chemotaxis protein